MNNTLNYILELCVGAGLLAITYFFTEFPVLRFIRVQIYLRKLKKELEPVARAVGAITKTYWVTEKEQVMYVFEFPSEKWTFNGLMGRSFTVNAWLTLEVWDGGFNFSVPSFSPPKKHTDDYESLTRAVTRISIRLSTKR